jgi:hypothetical protein
MMERKRLLERLRYKRVDNIKMDLRERGRERERIGWYGLD